MKLRFGAKKITGLRVLVPVALLAASALCLRAQAPANPAPATPNQDQGKPAQQSPPPGSQSNPFPDDTNNVPVLPSASQPAVSGTSSPDEPPPPLPAGDVDPVRSPDEPVADSTSADSSGSSSSSADIANIVAPPSDDDTEKSRKGKKLPAPEHTETAQEDETVGAYYLDQKNWKAALSRFQSALVLDPDNPDVYWGLAEAQRHLGDAAKAKANYMKVVQYDPDSKHAKDARKLLKDPEIAKVPTTPTHP